MLRELETLKGKVLWGIIFGLVVINCLTIAYFLKSDQPVVKATKESAEEEVVAQIGDEVITRQEWLAELEKRYGKSTLENMINVKVVDVLADQYQIEISEDAIERELQMFKATYNAFGEEVLQDKKDWREQIRYSILLEELLTKDVVVPEEEIKQFYQNHKDSFKIAPSYHLSHIVINNEEEAKQIVQELKEGSSFQALAAEQSLDEMTASNGGDLGFVPEHSDHIPKEYIEHAKQLKPNQWSDPIQIDQQFAIIYLHEKLDGVQYSFDEVKDQIRRQLALEQMEGNISAKKLWEEIGISWFYGETKE